MCKALWIAVGDVVRPRLTSSPATAALVTLAAGWPLLAERSSRLGTAYPSHLIAAAWCELLPSELGRMLPRSGNPSSLQGASLRALCWLLSPAGVNVALGTFLPCLPTSKFVSPPELEANAFGFFFLFLSLFLLDIAQGAPLYNALTGPGWPVREGSSFMKHGIPC